MKKSNIWGLALAAFVVSGAVAATTLAPALTRADGEENEVVYVLDPESGSYVTDLQTVSLSFPETPGIQFNETMTLPVLLKNTETGAEYHCDYPVRNPRVVEGTEFTLNFISSESTQLAPITVPGNYVLTIEEGAFFYGDEVEDADGNVTIANPTAVKAIEATYTLIEAAPAVAYTLEPEDGAIVNDLQTITISFEDANVMPNDKMELNAIVLTDEDGEEYYCEGPVRDTRVAQGVAYKLYFLTTVETEQGIESELKPITKPGAYTLSIMNGTFMRADEVEDADGNVTLENIVPVEAINATYTVVEQQADVVYVLDPEDGTYVNDLQTITISFPENSNIQANERMMLNSFVLTNIETGEEYYCDYPVRNPRAEQGTAFTLNFMTLVENEDGIESVLAPITELGTYELSIMQGAFVYGNEVEDEEGNVTLENVIPVQAINATYYITTSGVNAIFGADATEFDVYSVNGLQILKAADSNAVNALPSGLYIINGKKVIKK